MAEHLASIFGTEKDRVNCPFYFKIGACRHGDRCSRLHNRPNSSLTLLLANMYQSPDAGLAQTGGLDADGNIRQMDPKKMQEHFEDFYEDIFEELSKYGEVENLNVCDNLADHMIGNVYVKFREEEHATAALHAMSGRFYAGRPIMVEFCPVTDFREATCRQYEENTCTRGGYCNFMHLRKIGRDLRRKLFGNYRRSRSRSYSPYGRGDARGEDRRGGDVDFGSRRGRGGGGGGGGGGAWGALQGVPIPPPLQGGFAANLHGLVIGMVEKELQKIQNAQALAQAMSAIKEQIESSAAANNFYDFLGVNQNHPPPPHLPPHAPQ